MSEPRPAARAAVAVVVLGHLLALYWPRLPVAGPPNGDKLAHVVVFAAPTLAGVLLARRWWPAWIVALHAPVSELLQGSLLPGRSGDPLDLVADLVGVGLAALVLLARTAVRAGGPERTDSPG
ncbi:MAG: VanZ family protein [Dermatophilaceae bacterium]